jgi:hypothetical protein
VKLRGLIAVTLLAAGASACSSSEGTEGPNGSAVVADPDVAVTIGELDDVVVTVSPEDLSGEVIVIGDTVPETQPSVAPEREDSGVESQDVAPELNPLGGDDPENQLMPDVVCMDLQEAQDEIQDHGVFFSKSVDATGEDRRQILDRNWIVVAQSPAAGEPIGENEAVLSVVKDDEPSDC